MSETNQQQPPDERPNVPGPRPGVRLRAPGAAPSHPAEPSPPEETSALTPPPAAVEPPAPARTPAAEPPPAPAKRTARKAAAGRRSRGSAPPSEPSPPTTTATSSTASTDDQDARPPEPPPPPAFVEPDELSYAVADSIVGLSEAANARVAPGTDLLVADDEEALGVAHPLTRILVRHLPAGMAGPGNPDLADAIAAGITLFRYGLRQVRLWGELRRGRHGGDAETPPAPGADPLVV